MFFENFISLLYHTPDSVQTILLYYVAEILEVESFFLESESSPTPLIKTSTPIRLQQFSVPKYPTPI